LGTTLWINGGWPFLRPGYEWHLDEGYFRCGRNNILVEKRDEAGIRWVNVCTSNGDRVWTPNAVLIAMATSGALFDDDTDNPAEDQKAARFRECGVPYRRCDRCAEPIPHTVVQIGPHPTPVYLDWRRNETAELIHELRCVATLMKQPPRHDIRVRVIH
jgi:hypothetical protein